VYPDPCSAETVAPAVGLPEIAAQQGGGKGADIDAHVEDGETRIPPRIILAELFDFVVKEFIERISKTHPRWRRALLSKKTNKLVLLDHEPADMTGYHGGSPMYVFQRGGTAAAGGQNL